MSEQRTDKISCGREEEFSPLVVVAGLMITAYLTANIMAVKLVEIWGAAVFDAGTVTFPLAYMLGDVLTEIWGFRVAKKVIWLTFFCNIVLVAATSAGVLLPSPAYLQKTADAYAEVFTYVPRIVFASLLAFLCGELSNAYFMERIKKRTNGKYLWMRAIGSSAAGHLFDTVLFVCAAFGGTAAPADLFFMTVSQYALKLAAESICGTPLVYAAVRVLKKRRVPEEGGGVRRECA
ncbi:MAG: queuosine precursor transporter [Synergistaceae bacterium]|nr:queuosine precursor transporter [Synergistaceae bacterium]